MFPEKKKHITAGRALRSKVICQPDSWQFSPLMNVQHLPLTKTLGEGGNRPTLNTWDSRDVLSELHKALYTPVCVALTAWTDQPHKNEDLFHPASTQAVYCLISFSCGWRFTSTPTSCQAASPVISRADTKGFRVVSFNCEPFVYSHCCSVCIVHLL